MYSVICMYFDLDLVHIPKERTSSYAEYALFMRLIFISEGLLFYNLLQSPLHMVDWHLNDMIMLVVVVVV